MKMMMEGGREQESVSDGETERQAVVSASKRFQRDGTAEFDVRRHLHENIVLCGKRWSL